jgi:Holliday junction resolvase RusA-like endonuclease
LTRKQLFKVDLNGLEPHTHQTGRRYRKVKDELREAIYAKTGKEAIEEARKRINEKQVKIEVLFRLWKGSAVTTKTRSEKDLDNLLKPILDVLQTHADKQMSEQGLGLIENDDLIYEINARKEIVDSQSEEGVHIVIYPK